MNAKKIMGAVLVALLAAALFVGAGAAAASYTAGATVFTYQELDSSFDGTWTYDGDDATGSFTIVSSGVNYVADTNLPEGKYVKGPDFVFLEKPTGTVTAVIPGVASVIGGTVTKGDTVQFGISVPADVSNVGLLFISPDGTKTYQFGTLNSESAGGPVVIDDSIDAGEWKVMAYFSASATNMSALYLPLTGADVYTFTVSDVSKKLTLSADTVLKGNVFSATISGKVGTQVTLDVGDKVEIIAGQPGVQITNAAATKATVTISKTGSTIVSLKAKDDGKVTISAQFLNAGNPDGDAKTAKITIEEGSVTAEVGADFFYLGNDVIISGTNTETKKVYFYIKGSNVEFDELGNPMISEDVDADKTWEVEIDGDTFKNFDAGTYTIYVSAVNLTAEGLGIAEKNLETYDSVSVTLKQPFLTAELSSSIVAQGSELTITGTAEAAATLKFYIFGTNKFQFGELAVEDDGTFEEEIDIEKDAFSTGQYFVVIQHPMYDEVFNIGAVQDSGNVGNKISYNIILNTTGSYDAVNPITDKNILFNTLERQSSNAAEALCQALDTQNIDDIYVKATFIVATPTMNMNPVSDVAKGAKLIVSGTSNVAPGETVTVELLSTAFAAVPKEQVNSASFMTLTTKVQEDGTWEVAFDTTGLNVDEYSINAAISSVDVSTPTVTVKVLESAPVTPEQPDTPVTPEQPTDKPEQPTEPETPGFGALAALAGLGAVAVLLLRRE